MFVTYTIIVSLYDKTATQDLEKQEVKMNEIHDLFKSTVEVYSLTLSELKIFKGLKFYSAGLLDTKMFT